jgi:hypothetical protein
MCGYYMKGEAPFTLTIAIAIKYAKAKRGKRGAVPLE